MRKLLLGAAGLVALSSVNVFAADLPLRAPAPVEAAFSWTGLYVGGNVGWHGGSDSISTVSNPVGFPPPINAKMDALTPTSLKPQGATAGLQIGYNWQIDRFVVGIESDANWLEGSASRHLIFPFATGNFVPVGSFMDNSVSSRFIGTFRPRAGFTVDRLLLYATAGAAFGSIKTIDSFCNNGCPTPAGNSDSATGIATKVGWTAGAGAEWAITNSWSIKAEYLFVNLGSFSTLNLGSANCGAFLIPGSCSISTNHKYADNIVRVGANYHFNLW